MRKLMMWLLSSLMLLTACATAPVVQPSKAVCPQLPELEMLDLGAARHNYLLRMQRWLLNSPQTPNSYSLTPDTAKPNTPRLGTN
jgi:hypothetical protein